MPAYCIAYSQNVPVLPQLPPKLGGVVVFAPVGDFAVVAGDEDAGGEAGGVAGEAGGGAGGVAGEAVAAGEFPLAGGRVVLRHERAQRKADLGEGAEERRERLANGGYAAKRLTGSAGEDASGAKSCRIASMSAAFQAAVWCSRIAAGVRALVGMGE